MRHTRAGVPPRVLRELDLLGTWCDKDLDMMLAGASSDLFRRAITDALFDEFGLCDGMGIHVRPVPACGGSSGSEALRRASVWKQR